MDDRRVRLSPDGQSVIAENGPMRLVIQAWSHGQFRTKEAIEAAQFSFFCLEQVADHLPNLKRVNAVLPDKQQYPIVWQMITRARETGDRELTPMAAVAGSIADAVADRLFGGCITRAIVDNGGDIAIRLSRDEQVKAGLRTDLNRPDITHVMALSGKKHPSWGINTSGLGGRSLTMGIASAATAVAETSARADAAATSIANACYVPHDNIVRVPAGRIDPHTDIPALPVTVSVEKLDSVTIRAALGNAMARAESYVTKGLIFGAVIAAGGFVAATRGFEETAGSLTQQPGCRLKLIQCK